MGGKGGGDDVPGWYPAWQAEQARLAKEKAAADAAASAKATADAAAGAQKTVDDAKVTAATPAAADAPAVTATVAPPANDTLAPPYGGGTGNPANRPVCNAPGSGNLKTNGNPSTEPDYATNGSSVASLNVVLPFRITDQTNSGPSGTCPPTCPDDATVADITFAIAFDCHVSASTSIGGTCAGCSTAGWGMTGSNRGTYCPMGIVIRRECDAPSAA